MRGCKMFEVSFSVINLKTVLHCSEDLVMLTTFHQVIVAYFCFPKKIFDCQQCYLHCIILITFAYSICSIATSLLPFCRVLPRTQHQTRLFLRDLARTWPHCFCFQCVSHGSAITFVVAWTCAPSKTLRSEAAPPMWLHLLALSLKFSARIRHHITQQSANIVERLLTSP